MRKKEKKEREDMGNEEKRMKIVIKEEKAKQKELEKSKKVLEKRKDLQIVNPDILNRMKLAELDLSKIKSGETAIEQSKRKSKETKELKQKLNDDEAMTAEEIKKLTSLLGINLSIYKNITTENPKHMKKALKSAIAVKEKRAQGIHPMRTRSKSNK